jgi:hypothetical protein
MPPKWSQNDNWAVCPAVCANFYLAYLDMLITWGMAPLTTPTHASSEELKARQLALFFPSIHTLSPPHAKVTGTNAAASFSFCLNVLEIVTRRIYMHPRPKVEKSCTAVISLSLSLSLSVSARCCCCLCCNNGNWHWAATMNVILHFCTICTIFAWFAQFLLDLHHLFI